MRHSVRFLEVSLNGERLLIEMARRSADRSYVPRRSAFVSSATARKSRHPRSRTHQVQSYES